jgi:hypothetical protein
LVYNPGGIMTIYVSEGMKRYVGGTITETTGKDISGATFQIALSPDNQIPPTVWVTPTVNMQGATTASRVVKLLVDTGTTPGTYFVWARVTDNPEIEPLLLDGPIPVA